MSSQIPCRFCYNNWERIETESAKIFLNSKERKTLSKINQITLENLLTQAMANFRFNKILIMHAHALNDLTQLDPKDVVSAGGKLIIGSPYNN
jgi:hypothetical protein